MSGSHDPDDAMDHVPSAPSPPATPYPAFLSEDMDADGEYELDDEYEDHDPREWMMDHPPTRYPAFQEDYDPGYLEMLNAAKLAAEEDDFDMLDATTYEESGGPVVYPHVANTCIMHSSQRITRSKRKRVVRAVEILDVIPEMQGVGPGNVVRGSVEEKLKGKDGRLMSDHLSAYEEALDEAIEDYRELHGDAAPMPQLFSARELEGDAIQGLPRQERVREGPCSLCHGGLCTLGYELDAFSDISEVEFHLAGDEPQCQGKGKGRLVDLDDSSLRSTGKGKGKARLVEEHESPLQSSGKRKGRDMEKDDPGQVDDLGSLLTQAQGLCNTESTSKSASKSPKVSRSSGKQKSDQSTTKSSSRSKRSGK